MKKIVIRACLALLLTVGLMSVHVMPAAAIDKPVVVKGHVVTPKREPVSGVKVQIYCNGVLVGTSAATDATGYYEFTTDTAKCPVGGTLRLKVIPGDKYSYVQKIIKADQVVDLEFKDGFVVPEYGWLGGVAAGGAAIGAIAFVRRRQVSDAL